MIAERVTVCVFAGLGPLIGFFLARRAYRYEISLLRAVTVQLLRRTGGSAAVSYDAIRASEGAAVLVVNDAETRTIRLRLK